jgi:hypothetical protein
MIKNRYKSIINKWKKKYRKTSPKKIIATILKQLKIKLKKKAGVEDSFEWLGSQSKKTMIKKEYDL